MDWDLLIDTFPIVARQIFEHVDSKTLEKCTKVCQNWCQFLQNSKFYWAILTKSHPGWKKLLATANSKTVSVLGKAFISLRNFNSNFKVCPRFGCNPDHHRNLILNTHPIFCCIHKDELEIFKALVQIWPTFKRLRYHQSENVLRHLEINPFIFAICEGSIKILKHLLELIAKGFRFHKPKLDYEKKTPLDWASKFGRMEIFKLVLANKLGNINIGKSGRKFSPLIYTLWGARNDYVEIAKFLFDEMDGEKNLKEDGGITPLHYAAKAGNVELVKLISENITNGEKNPKNGRGETPLHMAAEYGHFGVVQTILANIPDKENPNPPDRLSGWTPLHAATRNGHEDVALAILLKIEERFIEYKEFNPEDFNGSTPLHQLARVGKSGRSMYFIMDNMGHRWDWNTYQRVLNTSNPPDKNGWTPLHWAARKGHLNFVQQIMNRLDERLDDKNPKDRHGCTPLHAAARNNHFEVVERILLDIRSDKNPKACNGSTPLHEACRYGYFDIVKILLENTKEEYNTKDGNGDTPLHLASKYGHDHVVNLLAEHILKPFLSVDAKSRTPLDMAKSDIFTKNFELFKNLSQKCTRKQ